MKAQTQHYKALTSQLSKAQNPGSDIFLLSPDEPLLLEKQKKSNPEPLKKKIFLGTYIELSPAHFPDEPNNLTN